MSLYLKGFASVMKSSNMEMKKISTNNHRSTDRTGTHTLA